MASEEKNPTLGNTRSFKRTRANIKIIFEVNETMKKNVKLSKDIIETATNDISAAGISMSCDYFIPKGTLLDIKIDKNPFYPGGTKEGEYMRVAGKVVSYIMESVNRYRLGIQFIEIDAKDKEAINKFVEANEKNA